MNSDYHVIGIINENDIDGIITQHELYLIFKEGLQLIRMFEVLIEILEDKELIKGEDKKAELSDVFNVLNSLEFLRKTPLYCMGRETHANIKLCIAAIVL